MERYFQLDKRLYRVKEELNDGKFKCFLIGTEISHGKYCPLIDPYKKYKPYIRLSKEVINKNLVTIAL